jgi:hypothetical protein
MENKSNQFQGGRFEYRAPERGGLETMAVMNTEAPHHGVRAINFTLKLSEEVASNSFKVEELK